MKDRKQRNGIEYIRTPHTHTHGRLLQVHAYCTCFQPVSAYLNSQDPEVQTGASAEHGAGHSARILLRPGRESAQTWARAGSAPQVVWWVEAARPCARDKEQ